MTAPYCHIHAALRLSRRRAQRREQALVQAQESLARTAARAAETLQRMAGAIASAVRQMQAFFDSPRGRAILADARVYGPDRTTRCLRETGKLPSELWPERP